MHFARRARGSRGGWRLNPRESIGTIWAEVDITASIRTRRRPRISPSTQVASFRRESSCGVSKPSLVKSLLRPHVIHHPTPNDSDRKVLARATKGPTL